MASIRKLKPEDPKSPWIVEYTDASGKRRRKTPKTGLKKDAEALRHKIERELVDGVHVARSATVTVAEAVAHWLDECKKRMQYNDLAPQTLATYRGSGGRVCKVIGAIKLTDVTHDLAQHVVDTLAADFAPRTVKAAVLALWQALDLAATVKFIKVNPVRLQRLRIPRALRASKIPTRAELVHVLSVSATRKKNEQERTRIMRHAMFCLALFSTLRRGEVCGLRWADVDTEKGVIRVRQSRSVYGPGATKTTAGMRAAPLPKIVLDALAAIPQPRGEYVFTRVGGKLPNPGNLHLYWYYLAAKAGLSERLPGERFGHSKPRYRFHDMRHAAASLMIAEGANPLHVQRAMGHASVSTTLGIYGHLFDSDDTVKNASDAISASFDATKTRHGLPSPS